MGIVKRARLRQKEDVDLEVYFDTEADAYVILMSNNTTKASTVIHRADLTDTKVMCRFLMKHMKMLYNCI